VTSLGGNVRIPREPKATLQRMVPESLGEWTLDAIERLVSAGIFESRAFDFKEVLPRAPDESGKAWLRKTIAAFANSSGGFLVLGVKDVLTLPAASRLVAQSGGAGGMALLFNAER
jgi:Putative DNA-binding domain